MSLSIYWLCLIPGVLWLATLIFAADRLNSVRISVTFFLVSVLCALGGFTLAWYHLFEAKRGFFVVVFAVPLIHVAIFELLRLMYQAIWHQNPCINVRSGRWLGDRPVDGFFTKYPPEKVISWSDIMFGLSQMLVFLVIVMTLMICSLALDW